MFTMFVQWLCSLLYRPEVSINEQAQKPVQTISIDPKSTPTVTKQSPHHGRKQC